jgi:hypothetical protein
MIAFIAPPAPVAFPRPRSFFPAPKDYGVSVRLQGSPARAAFARAGVDLPIHFPQHDVQRPNHRHHVRHQVPADHLVQRFQIDQ